MNIRKIKKHLLKITLASTFTCTAIAQEWTANQGSNSLTTSSKVVINQGTDDTHLGLRQAPHSDARSAIRINGWCYFGAANADYPYWAMNAYQGKDGDWHSFHSSLRGSVIGNYGNSIRFSSIDPNTVAPGLSEHMRINTVNGNVGIGTTNPNHPLSVNGTIQAKEVIVETDWSDFVFEDEYNLRSLREVESHIHNFGHLPDVPSAEIVESEGLSVGEAQKIMMQKIEELTLYVIEQDKRNSALEAEVRAQREEIERLKTN